MAYDPNAWEQFKQQGAAAVKAINAMPYVLAGGSAAPQPWAGSGGISPSTLQQLLGLVNSGDGTASPTGFRGGPPDTWSDPAYNRAGVPDASSGRVPIQRIPGLTLNAAIGEPNYSWSQEYYQY